MGTLAYINSWWLGGGGEVSAKALRAEYGLVLGSLPPPSLKVTSAADLRWPRAFVALLGMVAAAAPFVPHRCAPRGP